MYYWIRRSVCIGAVVVACIVFSSTNTAGAAASEVGRGACERKCGNDAYHDYLKCVQERDECDINNLPKYYDCVRSPKLCSSYYKGFEDCTNDFDQCYDAAINEYASCLGDCAYGDLY